MPTIGINNMRSLTIGLHSITIRKSLDDCCRYMEGRVDNGLYHVYLNDGYVTYTFVDL